MDYDAIVLAGGSARRLGGIDKPLLEFNGVSLLAVALAAVQGGRSIVVVGPRRSGYDSVGWMIEDPPDSGPAHALAAGLDRGSAPTVVVLGADFPFVRPGVIARLCEAAGGFDGAIATDGEDRDQFLLGAYDRTALTLSLRALGDTKGSSLAAALGPLRLARIKEETAAFDCDTWVDVARAKRLGPEEV